MYCLLCTAPYTGVYWRSGLVIFCVMNYLSLVCVLVLSDSATPRTVARQAPLSIGFSRQEYWSRLPFPSPGDLPDPDPSEDSLVLPDSSQGSASFSLGWCPLLPQPQVRAFHFLLLAPDLAFILLCLLLPAPPAAACGDISTEKCHHYLTVHGNFSISH